MADAPFTETMALHILEHESSPLRFENFCVDLFSELDQTPYVTTSRSYDMGRDGRGAAARLGGTPPFICCGTEADTVAKAEGDLDRLMQSVQPANLVFCFTDPSFSEYKAVQIEHMVRSKCPRILQIRSFGGRQLSDLAVRFPAVFGKHYAAELSNLRAALGVKSPTSVEIEVTGLRMALTTQLADDAQMRRRDLVRNLILTALSAGNALTTTGIAKAVSDSLKLPRLVNEAWLLLELNTLEASGHIAKYDSAYAIAERGLEELSTRTTEGAEHLLQGQETIRNQLGAQTGQNLTDKEFQIVWNTLQEGIVSMFVSHGATIIDSIASIATGSSALRDHEDLRTQITQIAGRISATLGKGNRIAEIGQAVEDMFYLRDSPAFHWLADVAEVFLHLCALGLEPHAQEQVIARLREILLVIDTDVVLSLLSAGEANHEAIKAMIAGWRRIGGRILVTPAVLEEASHHAWISDIDYDNVNSSLEKMSDDEASYLIANVFVRGFRAEQNKAKRKCTRRNWQYYISAFKGTRDHAYAKILELLKEDGCEMASEASASTQLASRIGQRVFERQKAAIHYLAIAELREKADRDGRMVAFLAALRSSLQGEHKTALIVSSSGALRFGAAVTKSELGAPEPVLYAPAVAWMLSLVPGVRLGAGTLRALLFDADFPVHLDVLERTALRVLHASEEYKMHLSRRGTLRAAMRDQIHKRAQQEGKLTDEVVGELCSQAPEGKEALAEVLAGAVDEIARSQSERRIAELEAQIKRLRSQTP
jgi:hypothetical protein